MDGISVNSSIIILALGIGTHFMLSTMLASRLDVREPPAAQTNIPYIGHVIGLMRSEFNYHVNFKVSPRINPVAFVLLVEVPHYYVQRAILLQMEILAVVSMCVIIRFDMKPNSGEWVMPKEYHTNVAAVLMEPDTDIEAVVELRKGYEDGRWAFGLRDSEMNFAVVHEDRID